MCALERVREAVTGDTVLEQRVDSVAASLAPIRELAVRSRVEPADLAQLTPLQRAQLEAATGVGNAGLDPSAPAEGELEYTSFEEIVDERGELVLEAARFMDEDGVIFRAGTTEPVAYVCQFRLEAPPELLESLHAALRRR